MKKIIITAILMVACIIANGQNYTTLGVGITQPVGVLHIHSSTVYIPPVPPGTNEDGGGNRVFDYQTTFHITNTNTGTSDGDGFMIDQFNNNVTFRQFEQGKMSFMAPNGQGFTHSRLRHRHHDSGGETPRRRQCPCGRIFQCHQQDCDRERLSDAHLGQGPCRGAGLRHLVYRLQRAEEQQHELDM